MHITTRPGSPAEETRARIIAAAKCIYEQNGTRGTTTREVAERAGVNEATLFRHFGNKQALLDAMREGACTVAVFESVLASLTGDLQTDLGAIAASLVARMHEQRALMCISLAEEVQVERSRSVPEWRGPMDIMQRLELFFNDRISAGEVRGDGRLLAAYFLSICFAYVIARKIWDSYVIKADDVNAMVGIFLNGVK